jgi:hypothetical protein
MLIIYSRHIKKKNLFLTHIPCNVHHNKPTSYLIYRRNLANVCMDSPDKHEDEFRIVVCDLAHR